MLRLTWGALVVSFKNGLVHDPTLTVLASHELEGGC